MEYILFFDHRYYFRKFNYWSTPCYQKFSSIFNCSSINSISYNNTFFLALPMIFLIIILLFIILFICTVLGLTIFSYRMQDLFGSLPKTIYTLFGNYPWKLIWSNRCSNISWFFCCSFNLFHKIHSNYDSLFNIFNFWNSYFLNTVRNVYVDVAIVSLFHQRR